MSLFSASQQPHEQQGQLAGLESLAALAHSEGEAERASCLFGAVEELRERLGLACPAWWRRAQRRLRAVAQGLPATEEVRMTREAGRAMTMEQAIEYALQGNE